MEQISSDIIGEIIQYLSFSIFSFVRTCKDFNILVNEKFSLINKQIIAGRPDVAYLELDRRFISTNPIGRYFKLQLILSQRITFKLCPDNILIERIFINEGIVFRGAQNVIPIEECIVRATVLGDLDLVAYFFEHKLNSVDIWPNMLGRCIRGRKEEYTYYNILTKLERKYDIECRPASAIIDFNQYPQIYRFFHVINNYEVYHQLINTIDYDLDDQPIVSDTQELFLPPDTDHFWFTNGSDVLKDIEDTVDLSYDIYEPDCSSKLKNAYYDHVYKLDIMICILSRFSLGEISKSFDVDVQSELISHDLHKMAKETLEGHSGVSGLFTIKFYLWQDVRIFIIDKYGEEFSDVTSKYEKFPFCGSLMEFLIMTTKFVGFPVCGPTFDLSR